MATESANGKSTRSLQSWGVTKRSVGRAFLLGFFLSASWFACRLPNPIVFIFSFLFFFFIVFVAEGLLYCC